MTLEQIAHLFLSAYEWLIANRQFVLQGAGALASLSAALILLRFLQGKWLCRHGRLYQIAVPQSADILPFAAEQLFAALHDVQEHWWRRLFSGPDHLSLEIAADKTGVRFYLWAPERIADVVVRLVHSAYEEADIRLLTRDYLDGPGSDALELVHHFPNVRLRRHRVAAARMVLQHDIALPIKTLREFEKTDPLAAITAVMADLQEGEGAIVQILLQPGGDWELARRARSLLSRIEKGRSIAQPAPNGQQILRAVRDYTPQEQQQVKSVGGKMSKLPFRVELRLLSIASASHRAYSRLRGLAAAYGQFHVATLNGWRRRDILFARRLLFLRHLRDRSFPLWGRRKSHCPLTGEHDVLTIEEMASLWHLPHPQVVETRGIVWSLSRKRAASQIGEEVTDGLVIARTSYQGEQREIKLPVQALYNHVGVIGKWGAGKTTLLIRLALACIERGIAVILLDPHGDMCEKLLPRIPAAHRDRVIYFNPAGDLDRPMGLNFLEAEPDQHPSQVKSEVTAMLTHLFGEEMIGPRSSYVLGNCVQTLQEVGGMTILEIADLLTDADFRKQAVLRVRNPAVAKFWYQFHERLAQKSPRLELDTISPLMNKIGAFATDPRVAHVVGQDRSAFRLREVMDEGKVLICNLSQGALGLDNSRLLGGAIASRVIQAAMARESIPEKERHPAVLIADEFHVWVGPAFPQALPQVRKYRLGLVLACQLLSQLASVQGLRSAFLSSGTLCVFKLGAEDGQSLSAELTGFYDAADLVRMDPYQVAIRMALGHETIPFSGETIPLEGGAAFDKAGMEAIQTACRERYGRPVGEVQEKIAGRVHLPPVDEGSSSLDVMDAALAADEIPMEVYNELEI